MLAINRKWENSYLSYLLLALTCINFMGKGSIVMLLFCGISFVLMGFQIKVDRFFLVYFFMFVAVAIASTAFYTGNEIIKSFSYCLPYAVGCNGCRLATNKGTYIKRIALTVFGGFLLYLIATYIYNAQIGFSDTRTLRNFWTGGYIAVTLIGLMTSVVIGYSFYVFFCQKKRILKVAMLAGLILAFTINFMTATRTPFVLIAVVYLVMFAFLLKDGDNSRRVRFSIGLILVVLLVFVVLAVDLFGIRSEILKSYLVDRFMNDSTAGRSYIAWQHFIRMPDHPWGGGYISQEIQFYAHNFLQEMYDSYGLVAFTMLLLVAGHILKNLFWLMRRPRKKDYELLLIAMMLSMSIQICMEPVLSGYPILLWCLFLLDGIVTAYSYEIKSLGETVGEIRSDTSECREV